MGQKPNIPKIKPIEDSTTKVGKPKNKRVIAHTFIGLEEFKIKLIKEFDASFPSHINLAHECGIRLSTLELLIRESKDNELLEQWLLLKENFLRAEYNNIKYSNKALAKDLWSLVHNIEYAKSITSVASGGNTFTIVPEGSNNED